MKASKTHDPVRRLAVIARVAKRKEGFLIPGQSYAGADVPLRFEDAAGREFALTPAGMAAGRWSPFETKSVRDKAYHQAEMARLAAERGGRIAPGEAYRTSKTPMAFIDAAGNRFRMEPRHVKVGRWSPFESLMPSDATARLQRVERLARKMGGRLVPGQTYKGHMSKLRFLDRDGREFTCAPTEMTRRRQWGIPDKPKTRRKDEFYEKLLKVVAERGGRVAPGQVYPGSTVKMRFIDAAGRTFEKRASEIMGGAWSPYEAQRARDPEWQLAHLKEIARSRGGDVLEGERYLGANVPLRFVDRYGNIFAAKPMHVKEGNWSPYEAGKASDPAYQTRVVGHIARRMGGRLMPGQGYMGNDTPLRFQDASGRCFELTPRALKGGAWSPYEREWRPVAPLPGETSAGTRLRVAREAMSEVLRREDLADRGGQGRPAAA